jgi:hypothetical protein
LPTPLGVANPVWLDDLEFDIARHVAPVRTGGPVSRPELRQIVAGASLFFGLCADRDAVKGLRVLADGIRRSADELLRVAG